MITSAGEHVGKENFHTLLVEMCVSLAAMEIRVRAPQKVKAELPYEIGNVYSSLHFDICA